jgi:hypothetical protein
MKKKESLMSLDEIAELHRLAQLIEPMLESLKKKDRKVPFDVNVFSDFQRACDPGIILRLTRHYNKSFEFLTDPADKFP